METSALKASPFPPVGDVPLHRNPPLAPSQELAYRNKCIQLKRRLNEIESNNDSTRKRISTERERVQKMRLLRAILLNQLKEMMAVSGKSLTSEQLKSLGITEIAEVEETMMVPPEGETLLDDSSDESEDEEIPEPSERPTRMRRMNNSYRESGVSGGVGGGVNSSAIKPSTTPAATTSYSQTGLPNLAPANAYSPITAKESGPHATSSFYAASTPLAAGSPSYSQHSAHPQQHGAESRYTAQQSSPIQQHQSLYQDGHQGGSLSHESNGVGGSHNSTIPLNAPIRPDSPFVQFQTHMRPQLEADSYPIDQIDARIEEEWKKLSDENRGLWEQRHEEQMLEYEQDLMTYNRARRRGGDYH